MLIQSNTLARIKSTLNASGYDADGITSAQFKGLTSAGKEIHRITFPNEETGQQDEGKVYVWSEGDMLVAEF